MSKAKPREGSSAGGKGTVLTTTDWYEIDHNKIARCGIIKVFLFLFLIEMNWG